MTCPRVAREGTQVVDNPRAKGIQVEIAHQLQEVDVFVDHDGFVPILEEVARPLMAAIELSGVPGQERAHAALQGASLGAHQKVGMVGQECPGIDSEMPGLCEVGYPPEEILPILVVAEYELAV